MAENQISSLHIASIEKRTWYHHCIPEVLELLNQHKPELLIGSSMGGYAALLFGALLGLRARAFGAQTTLLDVPWDRRWNAELERVRNNTEYPEYLDLSKLNHCPDSRIYYCEPVMEDKKHANNLKGKVEIVIRGCSSHEESARNLDRGILN